MISLAGRNATLWGPVDCARHLYEIGGLRGLFRGAGVTVAREIPALGSYMTAYTFVRHSFTADGHRHPSLGFDLLAGGTAGVTSWVSADMPAMQDGFP